jgi:hypothetical protein
MNAAIFFLLVSLLAQSPSAASVSMTSVLKHMMQTQKNDANWTDWQKKILETEVLPSAASYLQDVDMTRNGVHARVDWELMTRYLTHWGPQYWQKKRPLLLISVETSPSCGSVCRLKEGSLIESLSRRMARRGYLPVEKPHMHQVGYFSIHLDRQKKPGASLIEMEARWKWLGPTERHKVLQQTTDESPIELFQRLMFEVWTQRIQGRETEKATDRVPSSQEEWGLVAVGVTHYSELTPIREALVKLVSCEDLVMRGFLGHKAFFVCRSKGEGSLKRQAHDAMKHGLVLSSEGRSKVMHLELKTGETWYK